MVFENNQIDKNDINYCLQATRSEMSVNTTIIILHTFTFQVTTHIFGSVQL
jgi:hypothetical protein